MSGIRVTYTGLISFVSRLAIIFVNMAFVLIITRTLTVEEYGVWGVISNMLIYVVSVEMIIGYWVSREIARKKESGRTGVITSGMLSGGGIGAYIVFALVVGSQGGVDLDVILFAAVLIPFRYVFGTLMKINRSWRPHTTSYALVAQSFAQISFALVFVFYMEWGITGLIFSIALAQMICNVMLAIYVREKLRAKVEGAYIKKWFRLSWISMYPSLASIIFRLDIIIFTLITGSVVLVAFWTASLTIAFLIRHSALVSTAIYPKLLEGDGIKHVQKNLTLFFYISIPLTAMIIALAEPALFVLNPAYQEAHIALSILSIGIFFTALAAIFQEILTGNEKIDAIENASFREFAKSKLLLMPTIDAIQHGLYIAVFVAGLLVFLPAISDMELLIFWAILATAVNVPFTVYRYVLVKRSIGVQLEVPSMVKYVGAAVVVFGIMFAMQQEYLAYATIFEFLPALLVYVIGGILGYFAMTYAIDSKTRTLTYKIIQEIGKKP